MTHEERAARLKKINDDCSDYHHAEANGLTAHNLVVAIPWLLSEIERLEKVASEGISAVAWLTLLLRDANLTPYLKGPDAE